MSKQPQRNSSDLIAIAAVIFRSFPAEGIEINSISAALCVFDEENSVRMIITELQR